MARVLSLVGANHKIAPIAVRERLAVPKAHLPAFLRSLLAQPAVREAFVLSTCNRTEIYTLGEHPDGPAAVEAVLRAQTGQPADHLSRMTYQKAEADCVRHLFQVAAGLDSMILGEVQVLGQIREGFGVAAGAGASGKILGSLVRRAIQVGKRARTETAISAQAASLSYAAVELARQIVGDLTQSQTLVVGMGEMGKLAARTLASHGVRSAFFANRTIERAQALADQLGGRAIPMGAIAEHLPTVDIVITSTDAPDAVITRSLVAATLPARRGRPLFLIDLAVPRDVEPGVGQLDGVYVYNVDDLHAVVANNLAKRAREVQRVEAIVEEEVARFMTWRHTLVVEPTIAALRQRAEEIRRGEMGRVQGRLRHLTEADWNAIESLTLGIVNKMLHSPTVQLKEAASSSKANGYVEVVEALFSLQPAASGGQPPAVSDQPSAVGDDVELEPEDEADGVLADLVAKADG
ncbi:MAG: glutamyl-tRNA reductase [Chloroflexi bacterium]|nr:glutamyl-tRNA reductase [Chloroflexota bacterium]